jgi:CRP-like cAMP-binding protein
MPVSTLILARFPLLAPLPQATLLELSERMTLQTVDRRATLVDRRQPVATLGFLVDGRLQGVDFTVDGRKVGLYFVEADDYYGELSVVDQRPPAEYVVAAMKSTVALLDAGLARQLIAEHAVLAQAVLARLAARLREATAQRTLLSLPSPSQRLCVLLLQLPREATPQGEQVAQVPTHQELAIMINASRETVTRVFQVLFTRRVLARDGNALLLVQPEVLQGVAEGRIDLGRSA